MPLTRLPEVNQRLGNPNDPIAELRVRLNYLLRDMAQLINATAEGRAAAKYNAETAPPTTGMWAQGDYIPNSNPTVQGSPGSTYVIKGWICTASGTPGTWQADVDWIGFPFNVAWTTYNPSPTPASGAFTALGTVTAKYMQIGKLVFWLADITITTNGTAAGYIIVNLPVTQAGGAPGVIFGRESAIGGKMLEGTLFSATQAIVLNYDNTYPGGNGFRLVFGGFYEGA